jgi:imidazolonepropionase-like amidohydrolase
VVRDGRIVSVGGPVQAGRGVRRIDGRGRFLIPGLIDTHVHIGHPAALDDDALEKHPDLLAAYRAQLPRAYLAFGFTSIVDLDLDPKDSAWFEAAPLHPRLYGCGRGVRIAGGYMALGVPPNAAESDFPFLVYEPGRDAAWPATLDRAQHTPERLVQRVADEGGICVKAFVEPGFGIFDWPVPRPATLGALRAEATRRRLAFVVHATSVEAWRAAVTARADVIAHGLWHWKGDRLSAAPPAEARAVVEEAARSGLRIQPTLRVLRSGIFDASILDDPRLAWSLPPEVIAYLRGGEARAALRALAASYDAAARAAGETVGAERLIAVANERAAATLRLMLEAKATLLLGSDTPSGEGIGNPPGLNGRLEIQAWADAGIPPAVILRAATLQNAEAFGRSAEIGSIEPGKRADLVLLGADPLKAASAYDSIEMIFLGGEPIGREALRP